AAQEFRLQLDVFDGIGIGRQLFGRHFLRQFEFYRAAALRVERRFLNGAVEIAGRIDRFQINVVIKERLHTVVTRRQAGEIVNRKGDCRVVNDGSFTGRKIADIVSKDRRLVESGLPDGKARLAARTTADDDKEPARLRFIQKSVSHRNFKAQGCRI